ncbi:S24 family peptidase [Erythrobacter sp. HA6-11]
MAETAEILLERIDEWLTRQDRTRYWLSKEISGGKSTRIFTDIARTGSVPKEPRLRRIAEVTGLDVDYLMGRSDTAEQLQSEVGVADRRIEWKGPPSEPGIPLVGTGDCADIELHSDDGKLVSVERCSFDPEYHVRYISRPPALAGLRGLYAIYFHGQSMEPRFEAGEVGIVDPTRPPAPGDYVLVQLNNGETDDVVSVLAKRLVRATARELVLEQFNPAVTFTVPRSRIQRFHRILKQTDLLF